MIERKKKLLQKSHLPTIVIPLILFAPLYLSGKALVWGTVSTQFVPWWDFAWDTLLQGRLPLWNPWVGMGAPLVANYQAAIFYPPYWVLLIIYALAGIKWMSWGLTFIVIFHLIWSGLGVAKLMEELGLGKLAQTVGGLAFSLSGYMVARSGFLSINAAAAWLPWILLYSLRMVRSKKMAFWLLSGVIAFQLLAGHAQTAWYSITLAGLWVIYWSLSNSEIRIKIKSAWNSVSKFIIAGLLGAGLSAIQLLPTLEYLLQSQRSGEYGYAEAMTYSFWPWRFLTLLVPNLFGNPAAGNYWGYGNFWEDAVYIGFLPILVAISAGAKAIITKTNKADDHTTDNKHKFVLFLSGIVLIGFLLALGDNTFLFPFLYQNVPTFDLFQAPTRFSLWAEISLSIMAGVGIEQMTRPTGRRKYWTRLAAAGCIAVMGGAFLGWKLLADVNTTFFIPIGLAGLFGLGTTLLILFQPDEANDKYFKTWSSLLVILVAGDLLIAGWGLNPGVDSDFYLAETGNINGARTFISAEAEYDLKFNKYFRFDSFSPDSPWEEMHEDLVPNIPILRRIRMVNNFDPLVPGRFQNWIDEYNGIKDRAQHQMTSLMDVGQIISINTDQNQREILKSVKEVRINNLIRISFDDQETLDGISNQTTDYINNTILASSQSALESDCEGQGDGKLSISEKRPGYIRIKTELKNNSWLVWSQSWYPGWVAIIDGKEKLDVERSNYIFQAVCVPEGEHTVEIVYRPVSFYLGGGMTLLCLVLLISGIRLNKKRENIN